MRPCTLTWRPGLMPAMRRRPSQITVMTPLPSYSSASRAGTPPRGRRVTVRRVPCSSTRSRSMAAATRQHPDFSVVSRSSWASMLALLAQRLTRVRIFSVTLDMHQGNQDSRTCCSRAQVSLVALAGSTSGRNSPGAIAWSPRTTITSRSVCSRTWSGSGSSAGLPKNVARSSQRGPVMPAMREGWEIGLPSLVLAGDHQLELGAPGPVDLGRGAALASGLGCGSSCARRPRSPPLRGEAKARSSTARRATPAAPRRQRRCPRRPGVAARRLGGR